MTQVNVVRVLGSQVTEGVRVIAAYEYILTTNQIYQILFEVEDTELTIDRRCVMQWLLKYKSHDVAEIIDFEADIVEPSGTHFWSAFAMEDSNLTFSMIMFGQPDNGVADES